LEPRKARKEREETLTIRARQMRKDPTLAERFLWEWLRRNTAGIRIRRQHPFGDYIADFFCSRAKLVVEIDGQSHEGREAYDAERTAYFEAEGFEVVRFTNLQVIEEAQTVAEEIVALCVRRVSEMPVPRYKPVAPSSPTPSPPEGRRG
jgi:very-short-patch-repair endonuclease